MRARKFLPLLLIVILALSLVTSGCGVNSGGSASGPQKLTINIGTEPPQMNTILSTDSTSHDIQRHVFEGLSKLDKTGKPTYGVAKKWETSKDALEWTFTLRDTKWSDGTPVTASDFEWAFLEALKKENASEYAYLFYMFKNGQQYNEGKGKREDVGIKAIDDKTLKLTLERPSPFLLDLLAFGNFMPVNKAFYEKNKAKYGSEANMMLYNGPWMISSWKHETELKLVKNPNYWNTNEIKIEEITMMMIKDSTAAYNSFMAGELDMVGIPGALLDKAAKDGNTIINYPDGATFYVEFNLNDKIMANNNIRKALTYAIDRKTFISGVLKNSSLPALSFTNPVIFDENKKSFSIGIGNVVKDNDATAKDLFNAGLKELGLTAAPKIELIADDTDTAKNNAQALQQYWKKNLGFDVTISNMPFKARLERMTKKDFSIVMAGWSADFNDPISFLDMFETGNGNNHTSYSDKAYDSLLDQIRNEKDTKKRMDLLRTTEKKLMTDLPIGPIYHRYVSYTTKPTLKGVVRQFGQNYDLYWAYLGK